MHVAKAAERGTSSSRSNGLGGSCGVTLTCGIVCDLKVGETNIKIGTYVTERLQRQLKDELESLIARRKVMEHTHRVGGNASGASAHRKCFRGTWILIHTHRYQNG